MKQADRASNIFSSPRLTPDRALVLLLALLLPAMALLSFDYGITWDEPDHQIYGRMVLEFFTSGGRNTDSYHLLLNYLNGGLFDLVCALFQKITPFLNPYDARHLMNSVWGWSGLLFTGLLARRLFGGWAGVWAVLILALAPRYLGHSMNNPKDIPFAATVAFSLYAFSLARPEYPYVSRRAALLIIVAVASCLNIRAGGLLLIAYGGVFFGVLALRDSLWTKPRKLALFVCSLGAAVLAALVLGTLFWPWALRNPLVYPLEALRTISQYPWTGKVMFDGVLYNGTALPARYALQMHSLTMPLALLGGVLLALLFLTNRKDWRKCCCLLFAGLFPLAYIAFKASVLYGGIRHTLFIYPALTALAAGGWERFFQKMPGNWSKSIPVVLLAAALSQGAWFCWKHHPYEALYYNPFAGKLSTALAIYDNDYWGLSYKEAVDWIRTQHGPDEAIRVFSPEQGFGGQIVREYIRRFPNMLFSESSSDPELDYVLTLNRYLYSGVVKQFLADTEHVHVVAMDGMPLCFAVRAR